MVDVVQGGANPTLMVGPSSTGARRIAAIVMMTAILCALAGCGEPPVEWPESSPFPTRSIHLGMTHGELMRARTTLYVNEEGRIEEAVVRGWMHYGFTSSRIGPPDAGSRLIYVDIEENETNRPRAETRWAALVADLAADLGVEPECKELKYGRLDLRRATLLPRDATLAAAVEVHIESDAPGSEVAGVTTRIWLPEHASSLADGTRLPGAALLDWRPCEASPESLSTGAPP